jgi:small-conductance mechanosensitive channel
MSGRLAYDARRKQMISEVLEKSFMGNTVLSYVIFLISFFAGCFVIRLIEKVLVKRFMRWVEQVSPQVNGLLEGVIKKKLLPVGYVLVALLSIQTLVLTPRVGKMVEVVGLILLTFLGIRFVMTLISRALEAYWIGKQPGAARQNALKLLIRLARAVVWGIAVVLLLDNLGVKIAPLVAGLGIGGVAVALAGQAVLSDLFSCLAIFLDRPFEVGDFIIVGDFLGSVEYIGIKTTRLRSLSGEQIVFSNNDLTNSRVRNYKRMERRRVVFSLGVTYQTTVSHLQEGVDTIKKIISGVEDTVFDRAHFSSYGDFNLVIEVVYYVLSPDYNKYMDVQQQINLRIKEEFDKLGIEFAYPTQTVYLTKDAG